MYSANVAYAEANKVVDNLLDRIENLVSLEIDSAVKNGEFSCMIINNNYDPEAWVPVIEKLNRLGYHTSWDDYTLIVSWQH